MSYKYKQDFGKCFRDLPLPQNEGTISHPLIELDEVYRKAEAFDDIEERFNSYKTGVKEDYERDMTGTNLHLLLVGAAVKNHFDEFYVESEESDAKK